MSHKPPYKLDRPYSRTTTVEPESDEEDLSENVEKGKPVIRINKRADTKAAFIPLCPKQKKNLKKVQR